MVAAARRAQESLGKVSNGSAATRSSTEPAVLGPARELAPGAVEFAVAGQHAERPRPRGQAAATARTRKSWVLDEKTTASGSPVPSSRATWRLRFGPDLAHHPVPLAVREAGGVVPRLDLALEAGVGPEMMAVRGEMQPLGIGRQAPR